MTTTVAILGGSVSGLAAAEALAQLETIDTVYVFERQEYDAKRVDCGEAINDTTLIPLDNTPENGFMNDIDGFDLRVYSGTDRPPSATPLATSHLQCQAGYICDRDRVEHRWADQLARRGVVFETGHSVTPTEYRELVTTHDYLIDATGQPSLTHKTRGTVDAYTGDMVALSATVTGEFQSYVDRPRIFFEGYVGYAWAFPKSPHRANVGIGWAGDRRPDDYMTAFKTAARRNGFPIPTRDATNIYTIPRGPSLAPSQVAFPEENIFLVGDAAGIANRYQGEGICQGIRSSYLLATLIDQDTPDAYPTRLYEMMKPEYRLAHLMRGAWAEHENPELLAYVADSLDGLTVDDLTRHPKRVFARLIAHPTVAGSLFANRGMIKRLLTAYTDSWEYTASSTA